MKNKKIIILCIVIAIVLCLPVYILNVISKRNSIDMTEAYEIAYSSAKEWNRESKPYFISSVDDFQKSKFIKGEDGKRRYWNFDFVVANTNSHLLITIHDKKVINKLEVDSVVDDGRIINVDQLILTTSEAVQMAKKQCNLLPGENWAEGYHFVLERKNNHLILTVVGLSKEKVMARIRYDAQTYEYLP